MRKREELRTTFRSLAAETGVGAVAVPGLEPQGKTRALRGASRLWVISVSCDQNNNKTTLE